MPDKDKDQTNEQPQTVEGVEADGSKSWTTRFPSKNGAASTLSKIIERHTNPVQQQPDQEKGNGHKDGR